MRVLYRVCFTCALGFGIVGGGAACSNDDTLSCGEGTVQSGTTCVGTGTAGIKPEFGGVVAVAPASTTSIFVTWSAARDAVSPPERMRYAVFLAPNGGAIDYAKPTATTEPGALSFYAPALDPNATYTVAVRAIDDAGTTDANTVVKTGKPGADGAPPTFGGVKTATMGASGVVTLGWDAAADDLTPPEAIVYYVYAASSSSSVDYTIPSFVSHPGATTVDVPNLYDTNASYNFVVRARDAADNLDPNTAGASSRPGADTTPPRFTGCKSAVGDSAGSAVVAWDLASDDTTPPAILGYDIFAAPAGTAFDFGAPAATVTNVASARVTGLQSNTSWRFVCRARDFVGNRDQNLVERAAKTLLDDTAPTFGGLTSSNVDGLARTILITWAPAVDDRTPPEQMIYDVFEAGAPGGESYTGAPRASSAPGATSLLISDLTPDSKLYWVVRARDLGGNRDQNTVETSGTILVSFGRQVQPILTHDCAVTGCHVPGNPMAGLILSREFAYTALVGQKSAEMPSALRVKPTDTAASFFFQKIILNPPPVGWQMPAPATGSVLSQGEKDLIRRWIEQGAVNN